MTYKKDVRNNEDIPEHILQQAEDVDLSEGLNNPNKRVISTKIVLDGKTFWKATHKEAGVLWTANERDPKIINKVTGRGRGNLAFQKGDGAKQGGRPRGAKNGMTVKAACDKLACNPLDFLAAVVKGDNQALRGFNIRNPRDVTLAQKIKCAELLVNKLVGNAKSVDYDAEGNAIRDEKDVEGQSSQIQVYLPSRNQTVTVDVDDATVQEIEEVGVDQYLKDHEKELEVHDGNEDDKFVWKID